VIVVNNRLTLSSPSYHRRRLAYAADAASLNSPVRSNIRVFSRSITCTARQEGH